MFNNPPILYIQWWSCYVPNNFCRDRFVIFTANINQIKACRPASTLKFHYCTFAHEDKNNLKDSPGNHSDHFVCFRYHKSHVAAENIKNLISINQHGVSNHSTLLAAYQELDCHLEAKNVTRPVVIIADGHASRFDLSVLVFLRDKQLILITFHLTLQVSHNILIKWTKKFTVPIAPQKMNFLHFLTP